jgi:AcrR family transcriptional regulator
MTKKTENRRKELKEKVLNLTHDMVEEVGFANVKIRKIADRAGCSVGMIYNLFDGLDDMLVQINATTLDALYGQLTTAIGSSTHPEESLMRLSAAYIEFAHEKYNLWSMMYEHRMEADLPPGFSEKIDRIFRLVEKTVAPLIAGEEAHTSVHGQLEIGEDFGDHYDTEARKEITRSAKVLWAGLTGILSLELNGKLDTVGAESAQVLAEAFIGNFVRGMG